MFITSELHKIPSLLEINSILNMLFQEEVQVGFKEVEIIVFLRKQSL